MPSRFFGLRPSRRAFLIISGEGSEASFAAVAGFESAAAVAAAVEGVVADEGAADDAGAAEVGADEAGAGAWAAQGTATTMMSDARKALRRDIAKRVGVKGISWGFSRLYSLWLGAVS